MDISAVAALYAAHYGEQPRAIKLLREGGCSTYLAELGSGKALVKLVKPAFADTILSALAVMEYAFAQNIPVQRVLHTTSGESAVPLHDLEGYTLLAAFAFIEGRDMEPGERNEDCGALVGRLHAAMRAYPHALVEHGREFFIDRYLQVLRQKQVDEPTIRAYTAIGNALWEKVKDLPRGFCHGDLYAGNFLIQPDGGVALLDFDTACRAYPSFDIMVACDATDYFRYEPDAMPLSLDRLRAFLAGYRQYMPYSQQEEDAFCAWVGIRHFQLQATIAQAFGLDSFGGDLIAGQLKWLNSWCAQAKLW